jgi:signal transduction histidine kinase
MFDFSPKDIRKYKILGYLSLFLVFILLFVYGVRFYFSKSIVEDWSGISGEKKTEIHAECLNLFYGYQNQVSQFSYRLQLNKKLSSAISQQNTRKAFDALYETEGISDFNVEVYNTRLELLLFNGRQIYPDVSEMKRALNGERFSAAKESGIYTYLMVFDPVKSESGSIDGVMVSSVIIDINRDVQTRFFGKSGIRSEIFDKFHIEVLFSFDSLSNFMSGIDTSGNEYSVANLKNVNGKIFGRLYIPNLDQSSYLLNVIGKFNGVIGFVIFILNVLLIYWALIASMRAKYYSFRIIVAIAVLLLSRFMWLGMGFPGELFSELGSEIFSPIHYASGIGFGMAKSLGELSVTSLMLSFFSIFLVITSIKFFKSEYRGQNEEADSAPYKIKTAAVCLISLIISLAALSYYGTIIQSLIFDSTVKFVDKSEIFSFNQPELVVARLLILFLSVSLILILLSCSLVSAKYLNPYIGSNKLLRKNSTIVMILLVFFVNIIISFIPEQVIDFSLKLNLRLVIIALTGLFALYIQRQLSAVREYRFINLVNLSLLFLVCAVFIPAVLLNKITSLENRYLEKAAKEVSQQSSDKIAFLISTTLEDIADDPTIEDYLKDKNRSGKMAFSIWSRSKFYDEDLNSAVFVLDTAKNLVSDFNINPGELLSDSILSFTLRGVDKKQKTETEEQEITEEEPETLDITEVMNSMMTEESGVLQNKEMKFYSAVMPLQRTNLKNSRFNKIIGYVVIAAGYDAKNFLTQTNLGIFKNFTRDNILNKLTSNPVISEFSESEISGSSNKDISKALLKSLDAFRESVKDKVDKSSLRYDEFENEIYKSYYVLTENKNQGNAQKIYVVSIKVNDFSLSTFFFFRYLLFVVLIYLILLVVYLIIKGFTYLLDTESVKFVNFGFREKLFVSFLLASVIPIVILAIYTREFVNEKNEDFYKNQLISDLRIVDQYVKSKTETEPPLKEKKPLKEMQTGYSSLFDYGFSESDKNFNYYVRNKLAATTSEQLYKSDLLDTRISGSAYYNLVLLKKDYFSENQQIGDFTFIVGYKPIYDKLNNLTGIISTQTVFKQSEINQELTESLVYILGPYFSAVILLIFIVNFLSYRISNPILKLQKATEQLSKGNIDIQVKSNSKDEIGELVKSFNRMIKELQRSRAELKKAEREGAWRDIARQVAHEIKNPLTPMKLAMQHLYYAYTHGSNDFKSIIQTTNKLIIDQVETLNRIATEFSNFAKLPSRNYELLNMNGILSDVVNLMDTKGNIKTKLDPVVNKDLVFGDKDEIKRALINIIKNSIQATEEKYESGGGRIEIQSFRNNGYYSVKIADNGVGMDEETQAKLFEPYFSTKSSGMGLGLVITKKILDDMKARIKVKSHPHDGTEVEISFRISDSNKI